MEKICIVKRRQQYSQVKDKPAVNETSGSGLKSEDVMVNIVPENRKSFTGQLFAKGLNNDSGNEVSITMTPEQSNMLQESEYIKEMLDGTVKNTAFTVQRNAVGRIILNLRLNAAMHLRMLRSDHVCTMLQISRSLLMRMIHENKIKSYKIGRLRRFLLEDILEYLLRNEDSPT
jgi:excisionase family DNA binding protein